MFHVLEGEVRLVRPGADGTQIIFQRCRLGFIAEASLGSISYHCDAVATSPGRLLRFPLDGLRKALDEDRGFRDAWIGHLAEELRRLRGQCERLGMRGAAQRIVHYIETEGRGGVLVLEHSRKAWAAELGLSHEALYRTLRCLEREGTLRIEGSQVQIRSMRSR